jgi:hypothetical protein
MGKTSIEQCNVHIEVGFSNFAILSKMIILRIQTTHPPNDNAMERLEKICPYVVVLAIS